MDWFKPLAYAIILLRQEGYPNVFYADYYGATYNDCGNVVMQSHKQIIDTLIHARQNYAYGNQYTYFDDANIIGWTRLGNTDHPNAMAVILTDGGGGTKWMEVGRPNTIFTDVTGNIAGTVTTNEWGWGEFPVNGGSLSVWVGDDPVAVAGEVCFTCDNGHTVWGQNVYVVGSIPELGNWNTDNAILLSPDNYPSWKGTINVPPGTSFEWKCIKKDGSGVVWQPGANNSYPGTGTTTNGSF
jgi:alpha-amylase